MGLLALLFACAGVQAADPLFELEAFIVEETARSRPESLSPLTSRADLLFGQSLSVMDIPRSVTLVSPELMELLQIRSYEGLEKFGAGTQRVNYFGLAGSAFLRGARAGTYFNGMLRAYQRNEMPMSFGSLEGLEIIKGPVPAGFSPTLVGGAVNQRPKSPYFDRARGSVELTLGSWEERRLTLDYGAPVLLLDRPAAYRVAYTGHRSERFYENVPHDFDSFYAAAKVKLSERHRLFLGGEYYDFRSSEIPGINRPTTELLRNRRYVIGEPAPLVSPDWGGQVVRPLLEFPNTLALNPALHALAVPGPVARERIEPALLDRMLDLNDPAVVESLYSLRPGSQNDQAAALLDQVSRQPVDAYVYTPEYFEAGGGALTEQLPADRVLADPEDQADSRDFIVFGDLETRMGDDQRLLTRFFLEHLNTDKSSTYGFAMRTAQTVLEAQSRWSVEWPESGSRFGLGGSLRYTRAEMLQDFDAEPFSRRDLSRPGVSPNTVVVAGSGTGPDGLNFWSVFGNASQESEWLQAALFAGGSLAGNTPFRIDYGLRLENASWETGLPGEVDRAGDGQRQLRSLNGDTLLWQAHLNPHWRVAPGVVLYAAGQLGKALAPGDGGTVAGESSFTDVELLEGGLKLDLLEGRLFSALSIYHWDQATFSNRDAAARPLRARGLEWEWTWSPVQGLTLLGAFTAQRVYLRTDTLGFGALPLDEQGWALNGGILNAASGRAAPENPDMVFAGMPEKTAHLYLAYELGERLTLSGGPLWRDGYYHDMQRSLRIPGHTLWSLQLNYDWDSGWIRLHVENLFDQSYWIGQEPVFSAGTLVLQGTGRRVQVSAGLRF